MILKGDFKMSLHSGMKFRFTKGKLKGRIGYISKTVPVAGNEVLITTSKGSYWVNKYNLEQRVKWVK